jgi:hypothetical protein
MKLVAAMNGLAAAHPRYGYRIVCALLQQAGWRVNRNRFERLWRLEGHRVPPQQSLGRRRECIVEPAGAESHLILRLCERPHSTGRGHPHP